MSRKFKNSILRIYAKDGSIVGAGFHIYNNIGITCAHVIRNALQLSSESPAPLNQQVLIDFPFFQPVPVTAQIVNWMSDKSKNNDIAIIRWEEPILGEIQSQLVETNEYWNHSFRVCGFPLGYDKSGVWVGGLLKEETVDGRVQIQGINEFGYFIERGFSGAPVWDDDQDGIIGMVVSVDTDAEIRTAYMIPSTELLKVISDLPVNTENPISTADWTGNDTEIAISSKIGSHVKAVIGIAVDLSGSMKTNIQNDKGGQLTRLQSFNDSIAKLADKAQFISNKSEQFDADISIFVYGFGIQSIGVYDLLSLIEANARNIISESEIERLKEKYTREMRQKYSGYSGLGDLARSYGLGKLVNQFEQDIRGSAERDIRQRIFAEILARIDREIGDVTMNLDQIANLWRQGSNELSKFEDLIYGVTPMTRAFQLITARFEREVSNRYEDTNTILFLLSDGEPTDGDPLVIADQLKAKNVNIVSCFVVNDDIANPRVLYNQPQDQWSRGAKLMFDVASTIDLDSSLAQFLLQKGWAIESESKLFVQVNHSTILEEFIEVILIPLETQIDETDNF